MTINGVRFYIFIATGNYLSGIAFYALHHNVSLEKRKLTIMMIDNLCFSYESVNAVDFMKWKRDA